MHDMDDETRKEVLGEALMGELKAIREYVEDIPEIKRDVAQLKEDVGQLKDDVKLINAVVTDDSRTLKEYERRLDAHDVLLLKRKAA